MCKQAFKRMRRHLGLEVNREPLPAFAWPGGYPLLYLFRDGGCICPECVNANIWHVDEATRTGRGCNSHGGWAVDAVEAHMEGRPQVCDHCGAKTESAYGPTPDEITSEARAIAESAGLGDAPLDIVADWLGDNGHGALEMELRDVIR
jgi:hypothetical protein